VGQGPKTWKSRVPPFVTDLFVSPTARGSLLAGVAALFAASLDPKVYGPSLPSVQAAIRERPELEGVVLLGALAASSLLLLGGALGDSMRARKLILGGLAVELGAAVVSVVATVISPEGPLFVGSRLVGHGAAAFIIPASLALVATSYQGITRATAIGVAYGALGAGGAAGPILLQVLPGVRAPAFAAVIAACLLALWLGRDRIADLPRAVGPERRYVVGIAVWAFGIICLTVGLTWVGVPWDDPLRVALMVGGVLVLGLALAHDRWRSGETADSIRIDRRPAAVAVIIGVLLGIAQTAPMMQLPLYFRLVERVGPLVAVIALVPLFGALVLAGPIAGFLLSRASPRRLVGAGAIVVGAGNLLLAATVTAAGSYVLFIVPCLLVGAGYVIATTVRTAIIFSSVPRGLPATAAALNEASISVGSRIGIVIVTAIVANAAVASYEASLGAVSPTEAASAIDAFRQVLVAVGTPSWNQISETVAAVDAAPYRAAFAVGVATALTASGIVVVIGGAIAWVALGRRDPLATVYEHRDERADAVHPMV
jgi:DHA2 family multidrug resistance protein-like MFS transporter